MLWRAGVGGDYLFFYFWMNPNLESAENAEYGYYDEINVFEKVNFPAAKISQFILPKYPFFN